MSGARCFLNISLSSSLSRVALDPDLSVFFMNIGNSRLLFNETNPLVEALSSENMGQNEIEELPRAWQYILPQKFYDGWVINLQNLFRYD